MFHNSLPIFTCCVQNDSLETAELRDVQVQALQLLHLLLEDPDVVHEGDHPVCSHGRGMEASSGKQGGNMKRHAALGSVQHKQLGPDQPQQGHLVSHLQLGEARDVASPLHGAEEKPRCKLADTVDASEVWRLLGIGWVSGGGARLGSDEQGDVGGEVGWGRVGRGGAAAAVVEAKVEHWGARGRGSSLLHSWGHELFLFSLLWSLEQVER